MNIATEDIVVWKSI